MPEYLPVDEAHPLNPINYYGFTKLEIEKFMDWYDRLKDMRYVALRYFNAVGYDSEGKIRGKEKNPQMPQKKQRKRHESIIKNSATNPLT